MAVPGRINRRQQGVIAIRSRENRALYAKVGRTCIVSGVDQKPRLAVKGKAIGRCQLRCFGTALSPETILKWYWLLITG